METKEEVMSYLDAIMKAFDILSTARCACSPSDKAREARTILVHATEYLAFEYRSFSQHECFYN